MENYQELHIEQDFWDDFIVEAFEHIEEIETNAMSLEQNPEDMEIIHTMFRAFHTIKGLSGFVEHTIIQEVAHKTETMMDYCRKGELKVTTQIVDAILKSSDYIKRLCDDVESYKDGNFIHQIQALLVVLEDLVRVGDAPAEVKEATPAPVQVPDLESTPVLEFEPIVEEKEVQVEAAPTAKKSKKAKAVVEENIGPVADEPKGLEAFASMDFDLPVQSAESEVMASETDELETPEEQTVEAQEIEVAIQTFAKEVYTAGDVVVKVEKVELSEEEKALKSFQKGVIEKLKESNKPNAPEKAIESAEGKTPSANQEYMKVANYKIDHLVEMMGELIINQALIEQYCAEKYTDDKQLIANMSGFLRITRDLQYLSMSLRMVSLKPTFQKIVRIARDTIQELNKNVEFVTSGENTEIDRVVADKLLDPLVHLIKNAISHGVEETPEDRVACGKSPRAKVELNAYSKRGKIFIEVKDNGRGINTEIVYNKAVEKGLIDPEKTYTDAEIKEFILLPGFSTAKVVDNISGRGVGMDVVKTQILKIGGKVEIQSTLGEGSTFTLEVPVNHAIMNGMVIEINNEHFVVPTVNVKEFLQPTKEQWIFTKSKRTMIRVRDNIIPIVPLSTFFKGIKEPEHVPLVMILELDQELRAVPIVNVLTRQEVVVKPVGSEFAHLKFISGMSILGTGKVSLILDIDYMFRKEIKE